MLYVYYVYQVGPDVGRGLMNDRSVIRARFDVGRARDRVELVVGRGPVCVYLCMIYGILGNSLIFGLTIFSLCFRYFRIEREEPGMIAEHTPHFSAFCDLL